MQTILAFAFPSPHNCSEQTVRTCATDIAGSQKNRGPPAKCSPSNTQPVSFQACRSDNSLSGSTPPAPRRLAGEPRLALPLSISPTSHQPARARLRSSSGLVLWSAGHRSRCGAGLLHLQALLYRPGTPAAHLVSPKVDCQPLVEATAGQEEAEAQPAVAQLSRSRSDAAAASPTAAAASSGQRSCACPWDECFA